jgi:hypothetical protein
VPERRATPPVLAAAPSRRVVRSVLAFHRGVTRRGMTGPQLHGLLLRQLLHGGSRRVKRSACVMPGLHRTRPWGVLSGASLGKRLTSMTEEVPP